MPAIDVKVRVFRASLQPDSLLSLPIHGACSAYLHVGTGHIVVQLLDNFEPAIALVAGDALALPLNTNFCVQALKTAEIFLIQQPELHPDA